MWKFDDEFYLLLQDQLKINEERFSSELLENLGMLLVEKELDMTLKGQHPSCSTDPYCLSTCVLACL